MKNRFNNYTWGIAVALLFATMGCSKFEEINTDPEMPKVVNSSMISERIILGLANPPSQKSFMQPYMLTKQVAWTELPEGYQYNNLGEEESSLTGLNDAQYMVDFATTDGLAKSYAGIMHLARAIRFFEGTMKLGDIPYREALQGESEKVYFPKYDLQKDVFLGILAELEKADQLFQAGDKFTGDPVYAGNTLQWRKFTNTFALNVLIQLSRKAADPDLKVKERFKKIVDSGVLFASNADNFQLIRADKSGQTYPFYKVSNSFVIYPMVSSEIINPLKQKKDRRLFYYAAPSALKVANGKQQNDFDAYVGVDPSLPFGDIADIVVTKDFSKLNDRYSELVTGEPTQQYSYAQFCFIMAEATARGWIGGAAVDWYKRGIEASMKFAADNTPNQDQYTHKMFMDATYISAAIATYGQEFPQEIEKQIAEIILQKYLASYLQLSYTPYYDYRRTGYPVWKVNPSSSMNSEATDKIPVRWKYKDREYNYNSENVKEAVKRQFNGVDDPNQSMWLLK
ncbi:SusD/RagB family nutrient-binding outer membrane lipoprotein [Sphingobacterium prati]|uniref:SusD/RagB family nutrient-binding outer membrane lipoprotein n=1 Tax=Sphingobacterium prati TaxID=2737006 RepID=UPI0015519912|nr:SusD/RagB family nutrient-binding outer membrane lipoprotein [Sphingobacterium prati]NPE45287.1 SusD/RagB family nutrient-binding outer membrane lipoprotein [Sphingobacterium prati]